MNSTTIRDSIKALLIAAGAENVYTEDPKLDDWDAVVDHLRQSNAQYVQSWVIRRVASIPLTAEMGRAVRIGCEIHWNHTFTITLFFGYVENASEDQMQALIDQVLTYMQTKRTLGDTVFGSLNPMGLQMIRPAQLGGVGGWECVFTLSALAIESGLTME